MGGQTRDPVTGRGEKLHDEHQAFSETVGKVPPGGLLNRVQKGVGGMGRKGVPPTAGSWLEGIGERKKDF